MNQALLLCFVAFGLCSAAEWTRYRGPNGGGVSSDTGLPSEIGKEKNVVWKVKIPAGNSSPVIVDGKVFLTANEGDQRLVLCFDAQTGLELWRRQIAKARSETHHPLNGPTTPSPAADGENIYVFFPEFGMLSFTFEGKERWRVPMGPFSSVQGLATSPVFVDGLVVLFIDQTNDSFLAAYDAATGKEKWKVARASGFLGSYSTPAVYRPKAGPVQLVVAGALELTGYQARTGEKLWWSGGTTMAPATLPVLDGDTLYTLEPAGDAAPPFSQMLANDKNKDGKIQHEEWDDTVNGRIMRRLFQSIDEHYGNNDGAVDAEEWKKAFSVSGGGLTSLRLGGKGELPKSAVRWQYTKGLPYVTSPLVYDGVIYVVKDGGILTALDPNSGKVFKQGRLKDATGEYYASPIGADGKVFFLDKDGKLTILKAGPQWEILSMADLDEQAIATPAIAYRKLYVRTMGTLYCFGSAAKKN